MLHTPLEVQIVEDESDLDGLFEISFQRAAETGILVPEPHIMIVRDGDHALQKVRSGYRPDVVVSDYSLPGRLSGLQWMAAAKTELRQSMRILFTTHTNPELLVLAKQAGVQYVYKDDKSIKQLPSIIAEQLRSEPHYKKAL